MKKIILFTITACLMSFTFGVLVTRIIYNSKLYNKQFVIDSLQRKCDKLKELNDKLNCDKNFQPFILQQYEPISFHSQIVVNHESLFYRDIRKELEKNIFDLLINENTIDIRHEYVARTDKDIYTAVLKCVK